MRRAASAIVQPRFHPDGGNDKVVSRRCNIVCICIPKAAHRPMVASFNAAADIEISIDGVVTACPETLRTSPDNMTTKITSGMAT